VAKQRTEKTSVHAGDISRLGHVLVVGGTLAEWQDLGEQRWIERRATLADTAARAGAQWLTLRPYRRGDSHSGSAMQRVIEEHVGCTVVVDPCPDGRERFLQAVDALRARSTVVIDEAALAAELMAPAPSEPDLTVVLGPSTQLPSSLVWELSYCELVFIDTMWNDLSGVHLDHAINEFAHRHRRFGGIE
jgi:hypothetical protein